MQCHDLTAQVIDVVMLVYFREILSAFAENAICTYYVIYTGMYQVQTITLGLFQDAVFCYLEASFSTLNNSLPRLLV